MKIVIDEREDIIYSACISLLENQSWNIIISKEVLPLGDILIKDDDDTLRVIIERKSMQDLLSSIKDGRYEEQSYRLMNSTEFIPRHVFYIIEGMFSQLRSPRDKQTILSAIVSLNYFKGFSVFRTCSIHETAEFLLYSADKMDRELKKGKIPFLEKKSVNSEIAIDKNEPYCTVVKKVKKDNLTPENMGEIILCQIPGISSITAIAVMKFVNHSLPALIHILETDPISLEQIQIGDSAEKKTRKISKKNVENLQRFLLKV
jgi:ERCC4-type nuclease